MAEGSGEITSYTTAFACLCCSGTSIWAINCIAESGFKISYLTFGPILANGLLGLVRYGNPRFGRNMVKIHVISRNLSLFFAVSAVAGDLCLLNGYDELIAYSHLGISLLGFTAYSANKGDSLDIVTSLALCSLGFFCFTSENYWGFAAGIAYFANYFIFGTTGTFMDVPSMDLFLYGLCFFQFFSVKALGK